MQVANEHDDVIPLIWEGDTNNSPNYGARASWYAVQYLPSSMFGGQIGDVGGGNAYSRFNNYYNQLSSIDSPIRIDEMQLGFENDQLVISGDVVLEQNLDAGNYKIEFLVTNYFSDAYHSTVVRYADEAFTLTSQGDSQSYSHSFDLDNDWFIGNLKGIIIIQSTTGEPAGSAEYPLTGREIIQAGKSGFSGTVPLFSANLSSGPADLQVQFTNFSLPADGIEAFAWDFDGDGNVDSTEENPSYLYDTPGQYDVTLTITVDGEEHELTKSSYIDVQLPTSVSGEVAGIWRSAHNPYTITNDVTISSDKSLRIEPGVEIIVETGKKIQANGLLEIGEMDSDPVVISGTDWKGIKLIQNSNSNYINNTKISGASEIAVFAENSTVFFNSTVFEHNQGIGAAGAIFLSSCQNVEILSSIFRNNVGNQAGAIEMTASTVLLKNNLFVNNTGGMGASINFKGSSNATFTNNTVANNKTENENGEEFFIQMSTVDILNSIIDSEYQLAWNIAGSLNVEYSRVPEMIDGIGNITDNPNFTDPTSDIGAEIDASTSYWFLNEGSPCIDAGNPDESYNDKDNNGSPAYPAMGTLTNDMGAFGGNFIFEEWVENDHEISELISPLNANIYPNPFNPTTNISFVMTQTGEATVSIFDIRGRKVRTLVKQNLDSGRAVVSWNGTNESNQVVASGVYFAKIEANNQTTTKKMMLMK